LHNPKLKFTICLFQKIRDPDFRQDDKKEV